MPLSRSRLDPNRSSAQEQNWAPPLIRRCNVLGVGVSAINPSVALETIGKWIDYRECHYVCITGVHGVMESQRDPQLKHIHNRAGLVTPDGMPLVWISRLRGFRGVDRVYGPDLMLAIAGREFARRGHQSRHSPPSPPSIRDGVLRDTFGFDGVFVPVGASRESNKYREEGL